MNADARRALIAAALAEQDPQQALALCAQAADAGAVDPDLWACFGQHALATNSPWVAEILRCGLRHAPQDLQLLHGLLSTEWAARDYAGALATIEKSVEAYLDHPDRMVAASALYNLGAYSFNFLGYNLSIKALMRALELGFNNYDHAYALIFVSCFLDARQPPSAAQEWAKLWAAALPPPPPRRRPAPGLAARPLRVGVLLARPSCASLGTMLCPLLRALPAFSPAAVIFGDGPFGDGLRDASAPYPHVVDIAGLDDAAVDALVAAAELDVMIGFDFLPTTRRKYFFHTCAAPVKIQGAHALFSFEGRLFDILAMDSVVFPPEADGAYQETLARLPSFGLFDSYTATQRPPPAPSPLAEGAPPCLGSFNRPSKIDAATLNFWGLAMAAVPTARLLLCSEDYKNPDAQSRILAGLSSAGVAPSRVEFLLREPDYNSFLRRYDQVDVALDTLGFSGGLTTLDALLQGVPTVTVPQAHPWGRVSASLLTCIGLATECIGDNPQSGAEKVAALIADPARLATLRAGLRAQALASPMFDADLYWREALAAARAWLLDQYPDAA